jgi:hypothetical protein
MSNSGSHSGDDEWDAFLRDGAGDEDEVVLRIVLACVYERQLRFRCGAGPSRSARGSVRAAQSASAVRGPPPPLAVALRGKRWVLVPIPPTPRMCTPESEARAARRERQRAREMGGRVERVMPAVPDEDERLLKWV